jgi:putative membrane protein
MPKLTSSLFAQADLDRIAAAIHEAESRTSGEIVPYVVDKSDAYEDAVWRAALLFALVTLSGFVMARQFTEAWLPDLKVVALAVISAAGLGLLLVNYVPALKRVFTSGNMLDLRVYQRAAEVFIEEEIFTTRDRTGILIFLSLFERRVLVVGDSGINAKVEQSEWNEIVQRVVAGMRSGKTADGLIDAIKRCGLILQQHGVERRTDDRNELPDRLRLGDQT